MVGKLNDLVGVTSMRSHKEKKMARSTKNGH